MICTESAIANILKRDMSFHLVFLFNNRKMDKITTYQNIIIDFLKEQVSKLQTDVEKLIRNGKTNH